jgi:hypothetical protein
MKKIFYLKPKNCKDVISKISIESLEEAIIYFSKVKKLSKKSILDIYTVTDQL